MTPESRDATSSLGRRLAKRLFPLTVAVGAVIAIVLPASYYLLEFNALRHTADIHAQEFAARLHDIVLEAPTLWKYQADKYVRTVHELTPHRDITSVRVWDEAGQPVAAFSALGEAPASWWNSAESIGSAPIMFNNRRLGTVEVGIPRGRLLAVTLGLLAFSISMGSGLAFLVHRFPVRIVRDMEGQINELFERVQRSNADLARRAAEADTLLEVARATGSTLDEPMLFELITEGAARACHAVRCCLFLVDRPGAEPVHANSGRCAAASEAAERSAVHEAFSGGEPAIIDAPAGAGTETSLPGSLLAVPLLHQGVATGALVLESPGERRFSRDDVRLAMTLAGQAALALQNAGLVKNLRSALDELRAAQDALVQGAKHRAVGLLAAGMSHHLNNLLAVILGRVELMRRDVEEPKLDRGLEVVETAATDAADLVRRVQTFARRRPASTPTALDINAIVTDVVELTRLRWETDAHLRGIQIDVTTELGVIPAVAGEPAALREVVMNLMLNATDALPAGGTIGVRTWASATDVYCSVQDNGHGMSEEARQRLFEPFFTTKGPRRAGLGLSTSYAILQRHGGDIAVETAEAVGTTLTLRLPVAAAPGPPPAPAAAVPPPALTILLVDDEKPVRDIVAEMLTADGHRVLEAASGPHALAIMDGSEAIDLVLTDLGMAPMNGWRLAQALRARHPSIPVGLLTGWGDDPQGSAEERACVEFVLAKPADAAALGRALAGVFPGLSASR